MYDGYLLNAEGLLKRVDNMVNNSNYTFTELMNMHYYEFVIYHKLRSDDIEKQNDKYEDSMNNYKMPNMSSLMNNVPKPSLPNMNLPKV